MTTMEKAIENTDCKPPHKYKVCRIADLIQCLNIVIPAYHATKARKSTLFVFTASIFTILLIELRGLYSQTASMCARYTSNRNKRLIGNVEVYYRTLGRYDDVRVTAAIELNENEFAHTLQSCRATLLNDESILLLACYEYVIRDFIRLQTQIHARALYLRL